MAQAQVQRLVSLDCCAGGPQGSQPAAAMGGPELSSVLFLLRLVRLDQLLLHLRRHRLVVAEIERVAAAAGGAPTSARRRSLPVPTAAPAP